MISNLFIETSLAVFALLAITNPFGVLPMFISMTDDLRDDQRAGLLRLIVYVSSSIMVIFALIGPFVMESLFQVSVDELRVAGGILLMAIGMKNIISPPQEHGHDMGSASETEISSRLVPMAFPILVGPGALATVIIIDSESGKFVTFSAVFITMAVIFVLFSLTKYIERLLGKLALFILSRIMQVFIMTVGVKMLFTGISNIFGL